MRININLNEELVKQIDEIADKMFVSRSAYISFAVSQRIQADRILDNVPSLVDTLKVAIEIEQSKLD